MNNQHCKRTSTWQNWPPTSCKTITIQQLSSVHHCHAVSECIGFNVPLDTLHNKSYKDKETKHYIQAKHKRETERTALANKTIYLHLSRNVEFCSCSHYWLLWCRRWLHHQSRGQSTGIMWLQNMWAHIPCLHVKSATVLANLLTTLLVASKAKIPSSQWFATWILFGANILYVSTITVTEHT